MENIFADFLLNKGLYDTIEITEDNIVQLLFLMDGRIKLDCYCNECGEKRVFSMMPIRIFNPAVQCYQPVFEIAIQKQNGYLSGNIVSQPSWLSLEASNNQTKLPLWWDTMMQEALRIVHFPFFCAMDNDHRLDFTVRINADKLIKIGQYPSLADLTFPELKSYRNIIDEADLRELKKAVGLYSHGIGIGSYVYLRRVFEKIVDLAKERALSDGTIEGKTYYKSKMDEKVKLLKDYLPHTLLETPAFYGIVSKGIHELSEQECLKYFPVMQEAIVMILREWEQKRQDVIAEKNLKTALSKINSTVSKQK